MPDLKGDFKCISGVNVEESSLHMPLLDGSRPVELDRD